MARRQQEKTQQTQEELLQAALELFQENGFFATTIADITERAGYAKGSFYRHWQSKDDIILQLIERKLADYRAARTPRLAKAQSLSDALDAIWDFLDAIMDDSNWSRVFLEFTIHASRHENLKAELAKRGCRLSNPIFAELVRDFVSSDFPPEKMGALNTALFEGFLIHSVLGTGVLTKDDMRHAAKTLALALGSASSAAPVALSGASGLAQNFAPVSVPNSAPASAPHSTPAPFSPLDAVSVAEQALSRTAGDFDDTPETMRYRKLIESTPIA